MELSARWRNLASVAITIAVLGLAPPFAQTASAQPSAPAASAAAADQIRASTLLFYAAFNSALHGDLAPLSAVWSHRADVTDLSAAGGREVGWNAVYTGFRNIAQLYPGGHVVPKDILIVAGGDMGYSVCNETGQFRSEDGPMVSFSQRATNIFRLEDGQWKMVHHHTDAGSGGSQVAR